MGDGNIPWTAVTHYGTYYEFDREQIEDLHYYVGVMDDVWKTYQAGKRDAK